MNWATWKASANADIYHEMTQILQKLLAVIWASAIVSAKEHN